MKNINFKRIVGIVLALMAALALCGCGGEEAADDPNLGLYEAVKAEMWGMEMSVTDLWANGVSVELQAKGKCVLNFDGTTAKGKWTLEDGAFHAEAGGAELDGTLADGIIVAENVLDMGVNITFAKEGVEVSVNEGFGGATEITNPSKWDGWMELTDSYGIELEQSEYDIIGLIGTDSTGKTYFEIYRDDEDEAFLSMYADIADGVEIVPVIGEKDAWISDTYLTASDADYLHAYLTEGTLYMEFDFENFSGEQGYHVAVYLREIAD